MVKLSHNEINDMLESEDNGQTAIPEDAYSVFRFEIKESSADLLKQMKELPKKHYPQKREIDEDGNVTIRKTPSLARWKYKETENGIKLEDRDFDSVADVKKTDNGIDILTAWSGFEYKIRDNQDKPGAVVEFNGPINGLLRQNLLPKMTYVPGTLEAKFIDAQSGEDLTSYMGINQYGEIRKEKNKRNSRSDEEDFGNSQDYFGYNVNRAFNNELDFLPKHLPGQDYKNQRAQEEFGKTKKIYDHQKDTIRKRIEAAKASKRKVSGVVDADKKAEKKIKETKIPMSKMVKKGMEM